MKNSFLIVFLAAALWVGTVSAQGPAIITHQLCWSYNGTDSTLIGYYLFSSRSTTPLLINLLDQDGNTVDTSAGGTIKVGKCQNSTSALEHWRERFNLTQPKIKQA